MSTPEHEHWRQLTIRRPDDVRLMTSGPVPLPWQMDKRTVHNDRLTNNALDSDRFPHAERGTAGDALACLALGESIRRDIEIERANRVREALKLGATWNEVAAALSIDTDAARELLRAWAGGQHELYRSDLARGRTPFGLNAERYADILALIELEDDEVPAHA